ncbi:MAG: transglycosylase SLT domain-containing protein [Lautropia sp.]
MTERERFVGRSVALATALLAATLLAPATALAQIGGPIGAPVGVPNGLPGGAHGYNSNVGGALPPPVNNWSSNNAGRNTFGDRFNTGVSDRLNAPYERRAGDVRVPLPQQPQAQGSATGPRDPRDGRIGYDRAAGDQAPAERAPATRQLATAAGTESNSIETLRDLVQKGQMHETGLGMPKNLARAFDLYCEAGRSGYPDALIRMGWMFAEGNGVEKSAAAAGTLFRRAARFGSAAGADLAKRYPGQQELLPMCLKGTLVERGTAERPATTAELSAMAPKFDSPVVLRNPVLSAERTKFINTVIAEARAFKLDPRLVLAVMATESGFDPNAKSPKNAFGLMQLIPETAERFAVKNILDPVENIRGGMAYLRWLLSYFRGDVTLTLAAYNAGEGAVDKHSGVPPYSETLAYVQRIRALYPFDRHPYDASISSGISKAAPAQQPADPAGVNMVSIADRPPARN